MSVNGITGASSAYEYASQNSKPIKDDEGKLQTATANQEQSVVYEPSEKTEEKTNGKLYAPNNDLVSKLKSAAAAQTQRLQKIVSEMLTKQGKTYNAANGIKSIFENLEVDEATRLQAEKDISEDGELGVKKTSERIFEFAKALTGGDPDKMKEMQKAFEKGYQKATDSWGDELPQICRDTKDAVNKLFDDYAASFEESSES